MMTLVEAIATLKVGTPDEVADILRRAEIKGLKQSICECPVATYLSRLTELDIVVNGVYARERDDEMGTLGGKLPLAVQQFIGRFDRGEPQYADLLYDPTPVG